MSLTDSELETVMALAEPLPQENGSGFLAAERAREAAEGPVDTRWSATLPPKAAAAVADRRGS